VTDRISETVSSVIGTERSFSIDESGFSEIITVNQLLDRIDRPDPRNLQG